MVFIGVVDYGVDCHRSAAVPVEAVLRAVACGCFVFAPFFPAVAGVLIDFCVSCVGSSADGVGR